MDISKLSTEELQNLLVRIPDELDKRRLREKTKLLEEITKIASTRGYALKELIGKDARPAERNKAGAKTKVRKRKTAPVKYRDPKHPNLSWTGRGRKPRWVTEWLANGKKMEALAV